MAALKHENHGPSQDLTLSDWGATPATLLASIPKRTTRRTLASRIAKLQKQFARWMKAYARKRKTIHKRRLRDQNRKRRHAYRMRRARLLSAYKAKRGT